MVFEFVNQKFILIVLGLVINIISFCKVIGLEMKSRGENNLYNFYSKYDFVRV